MTRPIESPPDRDRVTVPGHLLSPRGGDHYILRVVGDSLESEHLCAGDYVIILRRQDWSPGDMCVVLVGDEATVKRLYPAEDGRIRLQPSDGRPAVEHPAEAVRVQGICVGIMRKF